MSDIATLPAQSGARAEPAADPAMAAVKLARASMDALTLKLGQSIEARVTTHLAAGLTQLSSGSETFVLRLETPIPVGTPVTVKVTPSPSGQPTVTVTQHPAPLPAPPLVVVATPPASVTATPATQPLPPPPSLRPAVPNVTPIVRPAPMPLQQVLADPVQAAARQTTIVPLLAQAGAILAAPTALPLPVLEAIARVMAGRLDLNRAAPDGKSLHQGVMRAGTVERGVRQPDDLRSKLLALRATLASFIGSKVDAVAPAAPRPPPPIPGEPPRAPQPAPAAPMPDLPPDETMRQLLGHTDGALARMKLLQLASSPPEARAAVQATGPELRFEVPMLLGAETGILQLLVERDGRHKPNPRERGWRMRFALNFSATGEVGADIALLGRAANISIWAAEPATADALEAMLPELAPALASHGLDVAGLRVRRGPPPRRPQAPGQLLDSAR